MKNLWIVALIVTGALAAGQGNRMMSYSNFDTDGNGKVTQEEFETTQQARMTAQAEAGRMMRNAANAPQFSDIDTNKDGNIDKKEFQTHQANNWANRSSGQGKNR
ncbi:MAG: hypothetical protein ACJAWW_000508 [Sulfurimonas sp.]|jgi:hypothetical protein